MVKRGHQNANDAYLPTYLTTYLPTYLYVQSYKAL